MSRAWNLGEGRNHNIDQVEYATMVVSGYQIRIDYLKNKIESEFRSRQISSELGYFRCGDWTGQNEKCYGECCHGKLACYVIDDFGYIFLTSGNASNLGEHIGKVDPLLFQSLKYEKIFEEFEMRDYQGICDEPPENGPMNWTNNFDDDLVKEYNTARPCTKEYSIYQMTNVPLKISDYQSVCSNQVCGHKIVYFF